MSLRVATAFTDAVQESRVVAAVTEGLAHAHIVRRCRDIVELRAVARTASIDSAVVDVSLRGLERDVVEGLARSGVHVVGVAPVGSVAHADAVALGLGAVVSPDLAGLTEALRRAANSGDERGSGTEHEAPERLVDRQATTSGAIVSVWGPPGAPGRTTLAVELAAALSRAGQDVLLIDLDTVGPSVAQHLGLIEDASGVAAAARAAARGAFEPLALAALAVTVPAGPRVLTGLPAPGRWPELRPAAVEAVLACCRRSVPWTVVDLGFGVEGSDLDWAEPDVPKRFGAARRVLSTSDSVLCVGLTDAVGLARLVRELPQIQSLAPTADLRVLLNRAAGRRDFRAARDLVRRSVGLVPAALTDDAKAAAKALAYGQPIANVAPSSDLVADVDTIAAGLAEAFGTYDLDREQTAGTHRRLLRRADRRHRRRHAGVV